ncbi:tetratricopeptide repeat protein [Kangiella sp.]|uniref:tetratricopeptide repeat protein n=1 Tax=Kangiella sp. TaxID=1920245 RepID=UPI003A932384
MNKRFYILLIQWLATLLLLAACSSKQPMVAENDLEPAHDHATYPDISHMSADQRSQLYFSILLANIASQQNLEDIAQSNFLDSAERTGSIALARRAAVAALEKHNYQQVNYALSIWLKHSPEDPDAHKVKMLTAVATEDYATANDELHLLLKLLPPSMDEQLYQLTQVTSYQDNADFIHYFNQESERLNHPVLKALEAYLLLNSHNPQFYQARIHRLLDGVLSENNKFLTAIELKGEALAIESNEQRADYLMSVVESKRLNSKQTFELGELLYTQKNYSGAILAFQQVLRKEPKNYQAQFLMAGSQYALEAYQESSDNFWQLARKNFKKDITSYYCADSALRNKDPVRAISCYEMVPPGNYFYTARTRLAHLLHEQGNWQYAMKSLQQAQQMVSLQEKQRLLQFEISFLTQIQQYELAAERIESALQVEPNKTSLYYQKLQLLNQVQSVEEMIDSINQLRAQADSDQLHKEITIIGAGMLQARDSHLSAYMMLEKEAARFPDDLDLLYVKALAGEPLGYFQQMEQDLRTILSLQPDHHDAMNALGYTLADMNRSLDEAQRLVEAAYQHDPENSAVLDSMGWVQYRLGNLQKALEFLQMAYQKQPLPEVAAHLGEVLWVMNEKEKATEIWQRALNQNPNNPYLMEVLQRFPEAQNAG